MDRHTHAITKVKKKLNKKKPCEDSYAKAVFETAGGARDTLISHELKPIHTQTHTYSTIIYDNGDDIDDYDDGHVGL